MDLTAVLIVMKKEKEKEDEEEEEVMDPKHGIW